MVSTQDFIGVSEMFAQAIIALAPVARGSVAQIL